MKALHVKETELAKEIGIHISKLSEYFYGKRPMPYSKLIRLCMALSVGYRIDGDFICQPDMFVVAANKIRKKENYTTKMMSEKTGVNPTSISSFLSGNRMLSNKNIEALFRFFDEPLTIND